jgi:elongator complex protein 4
MSFRSRKIVVAQTQTDSASRDQTTGIPLGVRPSPLDGRTTTSTGTPSLDSFLAGHFGLVLGTSLLVEESGTTDFSGTLLKYFAAQGVAHGQEIHVLGMHEAWGRELPGISIIEKSRRKPKEKKGDEEKMKIAWRYERLPEIGNGARGEDIQISFADP